MLLNAQRRRSEAKMTAAAHLPHLPISREVPLRQRSSVQTPLHSLAQEAINHPPVPSPRHSCPSQSLSVSTTCVPDLLCHPPCRREKGCVCWGSHGGQAFLPAVFKLLLITEIRLKQLPQLIKEQCGLWHLRADGTIGNS